MLKPEKLDWDSNFFKISIGQISISSTEQMENGIDAKGFDLIYIFSDVILNDSFQFSYRGTKVKFYKKLAFNFYESDFNIENIEPDYYYTNIETIRNLAYESGHFSRFNIDNQFKKNYFHKFYDKWVENALNLTHDNIFCIYKNSLNKIPIALITGSINEDSCLSKVGLFAVDKNHQGIGLGRSMLKHFEMLSIKNNQSEIEINTQLENISACKFYESQGYLQIDLKYIYHLWI